MFLTEIADKITKQKIKSLFENNISVTKDNDTIICKINNIEIFRIERDKYLPTIGWVEEQHQFPGKLEFFLRQSLKDEHIDYYDFRHTLEQVIIDKVFKKQFFDHYIVRWTGYIVTDQRRDNIIKSRFNIGGTRYTVYSLRQFNREERRYFSDYINFILEVESESIAKTIIRDCQPFLKEIDYDIDQYLLYRGIKQRIRQPLIVGTRRQQRKPWSTHQEFHNVLNQLIKERFGWEGRNGIFATGSVATASSYSFDNNPIIFFPIGNYRYIWHPQIKDFYVSFISQYQTELRNCKMSLDQEYKKQCIESVLRKFARNAKKAVKEMKDTDLKFAIKQQVEIMFDVDRYYGIVLDYNKHYLKSKEHPVVTKLKKLL